MHDMGTKYQKLYNNPSPFSRGREGSLTAKCPNVQIFWLKIWYKQNFSNFQIFRLKIWYKQNFSNFCSKMFKIYVLYFGQISSELSKIRSIRPHTPRITQNSHQLLTHLYYIMFQAPALAEDSREFQ